MSACMSQYDVPDPPVGCAMLPDSYVSFLNKRKMQNSADMVQHPSSHVRPVAASCSAEDQRLAERANADTQTS